MNPGDALPLRDIHLPAEPSWWPPAPGWWLLAAALGLLLWWLGRRLWQGLRRRRQRARLRAELRALMAAHADAPAAQLAAASELLRRACRWHAPHALHLQGDAWLVFLDGWHADAPFSRGPGRLLLDGPFRPRVDPGQVQAVLQLVEQRLHSLPDEADA